MLDRDRGIFRRLAVAVVVAATATAWATVLPGSAEARSAYCSPSGDYCTSVVRRSGAVFLRIGAAAQYVQRYRLCVTTPRSNRTCRRFPLRKDGPAYGSTVRWSRHFPREGPGVYRVAWHAGNQLGPKLTFRIR